MDRPYSSSSALEEDRAQRRYDQIQRVLATVRSDLLRLGTAEVAKTRAAVGFRIAIQNFLPITTAGYTDAIVVPRKRSEIENHDNDLVSASS